MSNDQIMNEDNVILI